MSESLILPSFWALAALWVGGIVGVGLAGRLAKSWAGPVLVALSGLMSLFWLWAWISTSSHAQFLDWPLGALTADFHLGFVWAWDLGAARMGLLVSSVSFLVHLFSLSYMKKERDRARYFAFLGLFTLAMLILVISYDLLSLFMAWELVGFCSWQLIGFWRERPAAARAATQAFWVNRVADLLLLAGILLLVALFGTTHLDRILPAMALDSASYYSLPKGYLLEWAGILLVLGAIGKSGQIPYHIWLPDAMEGPTPVSALLHAATMVAAGVFVLLRLHPLLDQTALLILLVLGLATAVYAAWRAWQQGDIKRILAFSTLSQLGLMMATLGSGHFEASFLHLFAHGFFKAGLFLGAGYLIHSAHEAFPQADAQNLTTLQGMARQHPWVGRAFTWAGAALAGVFLSTGFLSKEAMLSGLWALKHPLWQGGAVALFLLTAFLTARYTSRMLAVLWKKGDGSPHAHAGPLSEQGVVIVLAVLSFFPVLGALPWGEEGLWFVSTAGHSAPLWVHALEWGAVLAGLGLGWKQASTQAVPVAIRPLPEQKIWLAGWYFLSRTLAPAMAWWDRKVLDAAVLSFSRITVITAWMSRGLDRYVVDGVVKGLGLGLRSGQAVGYLLSEGKLQFLLASALILLTSALLISLL